MSDDLSNDILLQIQDQQHEMTRMLGRIEGNLTARVDNLESDARRNWWVTVCIAPALAVAHGVSRKLGLTI